MGNTRCKYCGKAAKKLLYICAMLYRENILYVLRCHNCGRVVLKRRKADNETQYAASQCQEISDRG